LCESVDFGPDFAFVLVVERATVILVAEDDPVVRNLINTVLTRSGYAVLLACDGIEAIQISRRHTGPIDLLLSDVTMPRLGGLELVRCLREDRPGLKALLISGRTSSEVAQGNTSFDFLAKPFLPVALKARIEAMLAGDPEDEPVDTV
jgi:two-component system, cell cycle sensor histidine kinase and response regulator CckA